MRQTPHCQKHPVTSLPNPPSHGDDDVPSGDVDKADDDSDDDRNGDFLRIFGVSPCLLFPVKVAVTGRIQSHTITPLCRATPRHPIAMNCTTIFSYASSSTLYSCQ